jgi:hypothetical protein
VTYSILTSNVLGVLLKSSYEYPGRYARWTVGFVAPAIQIEGLGIIRIAPKRFDVKRFDIFPLIIQIIPSMNRWMISD